jgi:azurin
MKSCVATIQSNDNMKFWMVGNRQFSAIWVGYLKFTYKRQT